MHFYGFIISLTRYSFVIDCFELLADLAQAHGSVGEHLVFGYLFLYDLCEDDLKGKAKTAFLQVLLKHEGLLLTLASVGCRVRIFSGWFLICASNCTAVHCHRTIHGLTILRLFRGKELGTVPTGSLDLVHLKSVDYFNFDN